MLPKGNAHDGEEGELEADVTYKQRVEQKDDEGCDGTGVQEVDSALGKVTYFYNSAEDDGTDYGG